MARGPYGQVIDRFAPPVGRFPPQMPPQFAGQVIDRNPAMAGQVIDRSPAFAGQVIDRAPQFAGPGMPQRAPLTAGLSNWPAWTGYGRR